MTDVKAIAIDGPSASGKSTVSKGVATTLGFIYVDSGALYRGVTWQAIRKGVDTKDADAVIESITTAAHTGKIGAPRLVVACLRHCGHSQRC